MYGNALDRGTGRWGGGRSRVAADLRRQGALDRKLVGGLFRCRPLEMYLVAYALSGKVFHDQRQAQRGWTRRPRAGAAQCK